MRVLVFGASTAQGYWDSQGGWPDRLKRHYDDVQRQDWSVEQPKVMNLGISGDTTADLLLRIENESKARINDKGIAIVITIGSNNAAIRDGKEQSTEDYSGELRQILDIAKSLTSQVMFAGFPAVDEAKTAPIPWANLYYRNERTKLFEDAAGSICAQMNIPFVPVIDKFLAKRSEGIELHSHDGLHPNDAGHQLIFELVRPELDKLLS